MSYTAEQLSEREFALREAEANDAEERYFEARPVDDGAMHRRSFRAGFERAWFTRGRAHADALDTIAKLKAHAEAMACRLDAWARIDECKCSDVDAYRRDLPDTAKTSAIPHNALEDARALRRGVMHNAALTGHRPKE